MGIFFKSSAGLRTFPLRFHLFCRKQLFRQTRSRASAGKMPSGKSSGEERVYSVPPLTFILPPRGEGWVEVGFMQFFIVFCIFFGIIKTRMITFLIYYYLG
jgi:hypothetical protein